MRSGAFPPPLYRSSQVGGRADGVGLTQPVEQPSAPVPAEWAGVVREAVGALADQHSEGHRA